MSPRPTLLCGHDPHRITSGDPAESRQPPLELERPWNRVRCEKGQHYGRLTITRILPPQGNNGIWCVCRCDCGKPRRDLAWRVVRGLVIECKACVLLRRAHGERVATAKLTEADVLAIRASQESTAALAKRYDMTRSAMYRVRVGDRWKHVGAEKRAG